MSEKPKTHRERAEEAARRMGAARGWQVAEKADVIADETYPAELVDAATKAACVIQDALDGNAMPTEGDLDDLRASLALYQPPGEPGKEG